MFFYNGALLGDGAWYAIAQALVTAVVGVFLLSSSVQGWFLGGFAVWWLRLLLGLGALFLIAGGLTTDLIGLGLAVAAWFVQRTVRPDPDGLAVRGAD
jgi:TRAP-type uncharacterized transport system fused permease subunit